jgi:hypothetical protein
LSWGALFEKTQIHEESVGIWARVAEPTVGKKKFLLPERFR